MSSAYRQSSASRPKVAEHDPDNGQAVGLANGFGFAAVGGVVVDQVHLEQT